MVFIEPPCINDYNSLNNNIYYHKFSKKIMWFKIDNAVRLQSNAVKKSLFRNLNTSYEKSWSRKNYAQGLGKHRAKIWHIFQTRCSIVAQTFMIKLFALKYFHRLQILGI